MPQHFNQLSFDGSTVVEQLTHKPKIQGLNSATGTRGQYYKRFNGRTL